jgi:peptide/nickel transport system substrate-binding protein
MALAGVTAALLGSAAMPAQAAEIVRVGMIEDVDTLDPAQGRTLGGRHVFTALCDKLFDIDENVNIVGRLVTAHEISPDGLTVTLKLRDGVVFHDDTPFNAEAVKFNLERALTIEESARKGDIRAIDKVDAVDPQTVKLTLKEPFAPLLAQLSDRAGMMVSPKAAGSMPPKEFGNQPVCSGPYRFVERVVQDRIVLERFDGYWNEDTAQFDRVEYRPVPDATVRLNNLLAGQLDLIDQVSTTDLPQLRSDPKFAVAEVTGLGHFHVAFNVGNGEAANNPYGQKPELRQAVAAAIDRNIINQVVFGGEYVIGNQTVPPTSQFYDKSKPIPPRDLEKARALIQQAGGAPPLTVLVNNSPSFVQAVQVLQALLGEAGITVNIQPAEASTAIGAASAGQFQSFLAFWSGRVDPDGNTFPYLGCSGSQNWGKYCNPAVDEVLNAASRTSDTAERASLYGKAADIWMQDNPYIFLFHQKWIFAHKAGLKGFRAIPDGLMRLDGVTLEE